MSTDDKLNMIFHKCYLVLCCIMVSLFIPGCTGPGLGDFLWKMYLDAKHGEVEIVIPESEIWRMDCTDLRYPQDNDYLTAENACSLEIDWSTDSWKYYCDGRSTNKLSEGKWTEWYEEGSGSIQDIFFFDGELEIETSTYVDGILDHNSTAFIDTRGAISEDWSRICFLPGEDWQSLDWIKEYGREKFVADTTGEYCVILCETGMLR